MASREQIIAAYQRWSGTADGKIILEDLKDKCLANPDDDIMDKLPHAVYYNCGLNAIWRHIENQMTAILTVEKQEFAEHKTTGD